MTSDNTADETRRGLFDSIAGQAKELAGALTGKDELVAEGQLQQAGAQARRDANSQQVVADAQVEQAAQELREGQQQAGEQRRAAYADAGEEQRTIEQIAAAERAAAETGAYRREQLGQAQATASAAADVHESLADAQSVRSVAEATERAAQRERDSLISDATAEERRAAELRGAADNS